MFVRNVDGLSWKIMILMSKIHFVMKLAKYSRVVP